MSSIQFDITTFEPESGWHLCSYRGWLIAVLPTNKGFTYEYLTPDGEGRKRESQSYPTIAAAMMQAKLAIKRRATLWLMDDWLSELQALEKISFQEYCHLFKSMH